MHQPIPFVLSKRHPPAPTPPVSRTRWTSSTGCEAAQELVVLAGWMDAFQSLSVLVGYLLQLVVFSRATSIPPSTTVAPSYIPQSCNGPNGPKELKSNKSKTKTKLKEGLYKLDYLSYIYHDDFL